MEDQFVPYKLAVKLKELGFNEVCFGYFRNPELLRMFNMQKYKGDHHIVDKYDYVKAPLSQQAFDWFRIKHNLLAYPVKYVLWRFEIDLINPKLAETENLVFEEGLVEKEDYLEAQQACLEKLINICNG